MRLESEPGQGSTFALVIPRSHGTRPVQDTATAPAGSERRPRVLVIDDEEAFRYVLRQYIGDPGYEVIEASDGSEGLRKAREILPEAIVLDLQMPRLDGYSVLAELAADPRTSGIAVAVATSLAIGPELRLRLAGARAVLFRRICSRARPWRRSCARRRSARGEAT